jgi:hypothetical protein
MISSGSARNRYDAIVSAAVPRVNTPLVRSPSAGSAWRV